MSQVTQCSGYHCGPALPEVAGPPTGTKPRREGFGAGGSTKSPYLSILKWSHDLDDDWGYPYSRNAPYPIYIYKMYTYICRLERAQTRYEGDLAN